MADISPENIARQQSANQQTIGSFRATETPYGLSQAMTDLKLTPQEQFLYQHHLDNLSGEGKVVQPNGDISTLLQAVVTGPDGRFYNIPTVWEGKALPPNEAAQRAASIGWDKWPSYIAPTLADERYMRMHQYMDHDVGIYRRANQPKRGGVE